VGEVVCAAKIGLRGFVAHPAGHVFGYCCFAAQSPYLQAQNVDTYATVLNKR
jgi:hypothetical protein